MYDINIYMYVLTFTVVYRYQGVVSLYVAVRVSQKVGVGLQRGNYIYDQRASQTCSKEQQD